MERKIYKKKCACFTSKLEFVVELIKITILCLSVFLSIIQKTAHQSKVGLSLHFFFAMLWDFQ